MPQLEINLKFIENLSQKVDELLYEIQNNMFLKSKKHMDENTFHVDSKKELIKTLNNKEGFVTCYWHENEKDEIEIKELTSATIRCYPIDISDTKKSINQQNKDGCYTIFSKAY